jgi:ABC-2 type transport system ATP-binding protein
VHDVEVDGNRVRLQVDTDQLDGVLRRLTEAGVRSLVSQPPTLEELFLRHYQPEQPAAQEVS